MTYTYDNSTANAHNPRTPPVRVRFGPGGTDEMGELLLQLLPSSAADFASLRADVAKKVLAGDVAGDEKLVADAPDDAQAHNALGAAYLQAGRVDDALTQLDDAIHLEPDYAVARFNIGLIAMMRGRTDDAIANLQRAIAARPDYAEAHNNLGVVRMGEGALDAAAAQFREVVRIRPESADAHYNLARALLAAGHLPDAIDHFHRAIVLEPDVPARIDDLAWILATSSDDTIRKPAEAVSLAEHAAALTGRTVPSVLDTLGAAYAAAGQYESAAQAAREAFDLASDRNASDMASAFLKRLDLYRQRKPYREVAGAHNDPGAK